jgi:membrane protease YdiL (CAAX protease family)
VIASVLAAIAFGINKRPLKFFHIRRIGWRDFGAALLAVPVVFSVVALAEPIIDHFGSSVPPGAASDPLRDSPLWPALVMAATAAVFEEFIYRGFIIEELGELIRSRRLAAVVAVVCSLHWHIMATTDGHSN